MSGYHEGKLKKNEIDRWEYDGLELTSGDAVEVWACEQWLRGRIEYLHATQEYQLILSSGPDSETILVLHAGMQARSPTRKLRPPYP